MNLIVDKPVSLQSSPFETDAGTQAGIGVLDATVCWPGDVIMYYFM